jgi:cardiolipin synthase A/B
MRQDTPAGLGGVHDRPAGWLSEVLLIDGAEYFSVLLHDLENARKIIFFETYILEGGRVSKRVLDALRKAAQRGVRVCLLVDGIGSADWISKTLANGSPPSFEVRVYHPLPWQALPRLLNLGTSYLSRFLDLIGIVNRRDHRKMVLIDDRVAFVGSVNLSDVHFQANHLDDSWHDVAIRVESADCEVMRESFLATWYRSWRMCKSDGLVQPLKRGFLSRRRMHPLILRNDSRFVRFKAYSWRLKMMSDAKERIWIANAYFVPSRGVQRALMKAASRGVDVRILLTAESDVQFMPWIARTHYAALMRSGIRLFEYQPRILHSKVIYIDDFVIIGSSNLNHRSLLHDLELDVFAQELETVQRVHKMFEEDFIESVEVESGSLAQLSFWQEIAVKVLFYFRRVL